MSQGDASLAPHWPLEHQDSLRVAHNKQNQSHYQYQNQQAGVGGHHLGSRQTLLSPSPSTCGSSSSISPSNNNSRSSTGSNKRRFVAASSQQANQKPSHNNNKQQTLKASLTQPDYHLLSQNLSAPLEEQSRKQEKQHRYQSYRAGGDASGSTTLPATPTAMRMPPANELEVGSFPGAPLLQTGGGQRTALKLTTSVGLQVGWRGQAPGSGRMEQLQLQRHPSAKNPQHPNQAQGHRQQSAAASQQASQVVELASPVHSSGGGGGCSADCPDCRLHPDELGHLSDCSCSGHAPNKSPLSQRPQQHRPLTAHASVPPLPSAAALDSALQARPPTLQPVHQPQQQQQQQQQLLQHHPLHSLHHHHQQHQQLVGVGGHSLVRQATYSAAPNTLTDSSLSAATPLAYNSDGYNQPSGRLATTAAPAHLSSRYQAHTAATFQRSATTDYAGPPGGPPTSSGSPPVRNQSAAAAMLPRPAGPGHPGQTDGCGGPTGNSSSGSNSKRDRADRSSRRLRRNHSQTAAAAEAAPQAAPLGDPMASHHNSVVSLNPCYSPASQQPSFGHQHLTGAAPVVAAACQAFCTPPPPPTIPVRLSHRNYSPWMHLSSYFFLPVGLVIVLFIVASPLLHYLW